VCAMASKSEPGTFDSSTTSAGASGNPKTSAKTPEGGSEGQEGRRKSQASKPPTRRRDEE
jgi:hypothetical protein